MKKAFLFFSTIMAFAALADAQTKPPAPTVTVQKFPPPKVVHDSNGNANAKKSPRIEQVKFAKPKNAQKAKSEKVPNQ